MAAKDVSTHCDNPSDQNKIIGSATQCAVSASQLVTCTKIVVPTLAWSVDCQEQVADAAKQVAGYVDSVVQAAQVRCCCCCCCVYVLCLWVARVPNQSASREIVTTRYRRAVEYVSFVTLVLRCV